MPGPAASRGQRPARGWAGGARRALPGLALALAGTALAPAAALAQVKPGWGNVGQQEEKGFTWTQPLFDGFWMAWTPATLAFFVFIFGCIALMGLLEWRNPGGNPRHGILGLDTTRGDRLFISLLGSAYIFLAWLAIFAPPLWVPLGLAVVWAGFVFWKV
jgi:predicted small integral membrane protein